MVFASTRDCAVNIMKRGNRWCVYPLKGVTCRRYDVSPFVRGVEAYGECTFEWEDKPRESFSYPPFERKDVYSRPEPLLEHVVQNCRTMIRYKPRS